MNPVDRAIWYIESHSDEPLSLEEIAANACVSRYHLLRAFGAATGTSIMRYLRGRRLSVAARRLSEGAADILKVAVDAGYGSHEAFSRAFKEQFGTTPESVRQQRHVQNVQLVEPISTDRGTFDAIESPRFENGKVLLIAGIAEHYGSMEASAGIPSQWQRFARYLGSIAPQVGPTTFGVCYNTDEEGSMDYLAAVEVSSFAALPHEFTRLRLAPTRYAVFTHRGHVSSIIGTWRTVWNAWLPDSGHVPADAPLFERYGERFNPETGLGGVELWLPLEA